MPNVQIRMNPSTIITNLKDHGSTDVIYSYDNERSYREVIKRDLQGTVTKYSFKWLGKICQ